MWPNEERALGTKTICRRFPWALYLYLPRSILPRTDVLRARTRYSTLFRGRWGPSSPVLLKHDLRFQNPSEFLNCHLNMACRSLAGFQLVSMSTTRLAATRLMPMLPALVDSRNTPALLVGRLNALMFFCLRCGAVRCGFSNQQGGGRDCGHGCGRGGEGNRSMNVQKDTNQGKDRQGGTDTYRVLHCSCYFV